VGKKLIIVLILIIVGVFFVLNKAKKTMKNSKPLNTSNVSEGSDQTINPKSTSSESNSLEEKAVEDPKVLIEPGT